MYNYAQKNRFINFKTSESSYTEEMLSVIFRRTEEFEMEYSKDVCNFSVNEIIDMYKQMNIVSVDRLKSYHCILNFYAVWCLNERLINDNQNHFSEINGSILNNFTNKFALNSKIITREQLLQIINQITNPRDQFTMIALFEIGKSKDFQELINLEMADIKNNEILFPSGRKAKVSDKFIEYAAKANETLEYIGPAGKVVPLIENGKIIKKSKNTYNDSDFNEGRRIYYSLKRIVDLLGLSKWITPNALVESGKIHMIKELAKQHNITPEEVVMRVDLLAEIEHQYSCSMHKSRQSFIKKYKEYLV